MMSTDPKAEASGFVDDLSSMLGARSWPARIQLSYPIEFGSETISTIELRRGRLGDLKGIKIDGMPSFDQLALVASRMSGKPLPVIERLDAEDAHEVVQCVLAFFMKCLAGGSKL